MPISINKNSESGARITVTVKCTLQCYHSYTSSSSSSSSSSTTTTTTTTTKYYTTTDPMVSMDRRGYSRNVCIGFCLRSLLPRLSDFWHTTSNCHQSTFLQVFPDDAHPQPFQTIVDSLASCKYTQTVGASSFGLYPPLFLFVVQLLVSLH